MSITAVTRKFTFDAGHRILGHESKCRNVHGHRYVAEITVTTPQLDNLGRVIDFSVLKYKVGEWINEHLDHNFLCHEDDPLLNVGKETDSKDLFGREPFVMPHGMNPTAENIALLLSNVASNLLATHLISVCRVRVWETENCYADHHVQLIVDADNENQDEEEDNG